MTWSVIRSILIEGAVYRLASVADERTVRKVLVTGEGSIEIALCNDDKFLEQYEKIIRDLELISRLSLGSGVAVPPLKELCEHIEDTMNQFIDAKKNLDERTDDISKKEDESLDYYDMMCKVQAAAENIKKAVDEMTHLRMALLTNCTGMRINLDRMFNSRAIIG